MLAFEYLEKWAKERPEREAVVYGDRRFTYADYEREVNRVARGLLKLGVQRGDKVGLYIPNHPEFVFGYIACMKLGAAAVPVTWRFSASEVKYILGHSDTSVVIMEPGFMDSDFIAKLNEIRGELPQLRDVVVIGSAEEAEMVPGAITYDDFLSDDTELDAELQARKKEVEEDDTALILFTSGTTGQPKAPMLAQSNLVQYVAGQIESSGISDDERLLMDIPNNHVGGAVMAIFSVLYSGNTLVMLDTFIPQQVLQTVQDERISVMGQVPAQYILLFMQPDFDSYDLSSVKFAVTSGAPVPPELVSQIEDKMGIIPFVGYGLTETSGAITFTRQEHPPEKISGTIGIPNEGIDVRIMSPERQEMPRGEAGEITVRGGAVMKGYYKQPEATAEVFDADGFFYTGDMGFIDEDGFVHIMGRKKEMYIRGGENVYPPEVEDVILQHPKVLFAAVLGYPDAVMGEKGRAYVVPQPGVEVTEDEIKEFCREHLAKYKVPDQVIFREALPLTPLGKVHKFVLYEEMEGEK
ncbi:MAG: AMP-binding protein [Actinobacteria bacterium]|nr:AMP-binding protein [Actinomycetota bacterium]